MNRNKWLLTIIMMGLAVILLSGCSLWGDGDKTGEIDPPPQNTEKQQAEGDTEPTDADVVTEVMEVTAYFKDAHGYVAPLTLEVPKDPGKARATLEYMVDGGPGLAHLPEGFQALIPQGTKITMNIVKDKTAIVDFSEEFTSYNAQDERKMLEAITWALTGFDTIDKVTFWVNGEPLAEMPRDATPLHEPLSRSMGINLEYANGVDYGRSTPVTLYFQGESTDGLGYFVPVTRMIARTDNLAHAAMTELIKGPMNGNLSSVLDPASKVLEVSKIEDLINVNFDSSLLNPDREAATESIQSVILSLTETTGMNKVQIMVDGSTDVKSTDDQLYNTPVLRPTQVNKIGL
jgi:germination protein M